jgi:hypothetical protein
VKTLQLGVVVGAAVLGSGSPAFGQVDVNHEGGQTVFSIAIQPGLPFEVSAAFACPGEEACRPGVVRVVFGTFTRKRPSYDDDHSVSMVIDGESRLSIPNTQYAVRRAAANQVYENVNRQSRKRRKPAAPGPTRAESGTFYEEDAGRKRDAAGQSVCSMFWFSRKKSSGS